MSDTRLDEIEQRVWRSTNEECEFRSDRGRRCTSKDRPRCGPCMLVFGFMGILRAALAEAVAERDKEWREALSVEEWNCPYPAFAKMWLRSSVSEAVSEERKALRARHRGRTVVGRASDGGGTDWQECAICKVESPCATAIDLAALDARSGEHADGSACLLREEPKPE